MYFWGFLELILFIGKLPNQKQNKKCHSYRYYVVGAKIGEADYTVKITIGVKGSSKYYDHSLTEIGKGNLLNYIDALSPTFEIEKSPLSEIKDTKLISILQTNSSKVVDENGEPMVVYHSTQSDFDAFNKRFIDKAIDQGIIGSGFYFTSDYENANNYANNPHKTQVRIHHRISNAILNEEKTIEVLGLN